MGLASNDTDSPVMRGRHCGRFVITTRPQLGGYRVHTIAELSPPVNEGRPFWADDPAFDLRHHVRQLPCPPPGDQRALLDVAAAVTRELLPRSRPLWSATFATGLADRGTGLVIVMNHVLADGVGGLAVLAKLVDEIAGLPPGNPERARSRSPLPAHAPPTPGQAGRVA